ncbi:MAG: hypothetical protein ABI954_01330 [Pyrinomonadaceae bacterium]
MREAIPVKISNVILDQGLATDRTVANKIIGKCSVRVSPSGYFSALFLLTFTAGFLNHLGFVWSGLIAASVAWAIIPMLFWFDRVEFDGKNLTRKGAMALVRGVFNSTPHRLKIADIEHVETQSLWSLKNGGRVYYRYQSEVSGGGMTFSFASGGKSYRQMVKTLFSLVPEEKLDARSIELRDFLVEPKELERKIKKLKLPSSDILDSTLPKLKRSTFRRDSLKILYQIEETAEVSSYKAVELRQAANELRVAGNLSQAIEAFRRALLWQPENAWLLYEFARGLFSYANAAKNAAWSRRAAAALRLAAKRGKQDAALLTRIGESYFQSGNFDLAAKVFRQTLQIQEENFRAECGLGEIGLQDGKIAHVVYHFQAAVRSAGDSATRRWAQTEAEYFSLLNDNLDYMETEVSRISWLGSVSRGKRICLRLTFINLPVILAGTFADETIAALGWAMTAATASAWAFLTFAESFLDSRSNPSDVLEDE